MVSSLQHLVQYTGPAADLCLLSVLVFRKRVRSFPVFTFLPISDLLWFLLYAAFGLGSGYVGYLFLDIFSVLLQLAVIGELLYRVMPSRSSLAPEGRRRFRNLLLTGLLVAAVPALLFSPPNVSSLTLYTSKLDLFSGFLVCEAVAAMMVSAHLVGLGWRNHALAVGQGLMLWALSYVILEGLVPYLHVGKEAVQILFYARIAIYLATSAYWSVSLWRNEPVRKPISPEMRKYIVALHDQVHYDLGKVGH